jgi:AGZA family xanthine/uracil permease-like MFS transporter
MGLNAYFTYTVVKGMGIPWQAALGAVFLSGVAFLLLTVLGVRQLIISTIPYELHAAVAAGVGLFIALHRFPELGHRRAQRRHHGHAGQPRRQEHRAGHFRPAADLRAAGLEGARGHVDRHPRDHRRRPATGVAKWSPQSYRLGDLSATAFKLDLSATLRIGFLEIVFVFLFIDLFDNIGTLLAVGKKAGLFDQTHQIPRVNRILLSDATATMVGFAHRHFDGGELHRKRRGSGRRRPHGRHRHGHRPLFVGGAIRGAGGGRHPRRRHRAGADCRGQPHDGGGGGE